MPKRPKPGHLSRKEAREIVGMSQSTFQRYLLSGEVHGAMGLPKPNGEIHIPEKEFRANAERIRRLGDLHTRAARAGRVPKKGEKEKEKRFKEAIEHAKTSEGRLPLWVLQRFSGREDELPKEAKEALERHAAVVDAERKAKAKEHYEKTRAPDKGAAIEALEKAEVGKLPRWALMAVRYEENLPGHLVQKREEDAKAKHANKNKKRKAKQKKRRIERAIKHVEENEPGSYPFNVTVLLNGETGLPGHVREKLLEHMQIMDERERARTDKRNRSRANRSRGARLAHAKKLARGGKVPLPLSAVRLLKSEENLPADVQRGLDAHDEEVTRRSRIRDRIYAKARRRGNLTEGEIEFLESQGELPKSVREGLMAQREKSQSKPEEVNERTRNRDLPLWFLELEREHSKALSSLSSYLMENMGKANSPANRKKQEMLENKANELGTRLKRARKELGVTVD